MRRLNRICFSLLGFLFIAGFSETAFSTTPELFLSNSIQDTIISNQILYNGRAWRNTYTAVKGDPYLFSSQFMTGSVTISGITFKNNKLLYDICKDEVMILSDRNFILQLNKELMERFTLTYNNQVYRFVKITQDSTKILNGFLNELYAGRSAVYVKYKKTIDSKAVEDKYDGLVESFKVYVIKDGIPHLVKTRRQLIGLFKDNKQKITAYIRSNRLEISGKRPESFVPVAEYYDSLSGNK
jgi:hypothetical protein